MKQVRSVPRFRCGFCKRVSTKYAMILHEKRCFRNPNRFCDACDNTGKIDSGFEEWMNVSEDCHFCSKRDEKLEASIAKREAEEKKATEGPKITEIPF